jgi:hypothetical protein
MRPEKVGQRLKDYLLSQGVPCDDGVSEDRIAEFEHRHNVQMPVDFRCYFMTMNGSAGAYGYGMIRFWKLDEVKSIAEEIDNTLPTASVIQAAYLEPIEGAEHYFVFADFLHESQLYAIHLSLSQDDGVNQVVVLDGSAPIKVADTFSQFVDVYITSPECLRLVVD